MVDWVGVMVVGGDFGAVVAGPPPAGAAAPPPGAPPQGGRAEGAAPGPPAAGHGALVPLEPRGGDEGLLRHFAPADRLHLLFAFLLLLGELALGGDVTAVALGQHVLPLGL